MRIRMKNKNKRRRFLDFNVYHRYCIWLNDRLQQNDILMLRKDEYNKTRKGMNRGEMLKNRNNLINFSI